MHLIFSLVALGFPCKPFKINILQSVLQVQVQIHVCNTWALPINNHIGILSYTHE